MVRLRRMSRDSQLHAGHLQRMQVDPDLGRIRQAETVHGGADRTGGMKRSGSHDTETQKKVKAGTAAGAGGLLRPGGQPVPGLGADMLPGRTHGDLRQAGEPAKAGQIPELAKEAAMTVKEFARQSGIEYNEVLNAVFFSEIHKRGKNVNYPFEKLRSAVVEWLQIKERRAEHKLANVRRDLVRAYAVESDEG